MTDTLVRPTVLSRLLLAKQHSDRKEYRSKLEILRQLIREDPTSFKIDSELPNGIVGLTHSSGFQLHAPKVGLPGEIKLERLAPETDLQKEQHRWAVRPPLEALVDSHGEQALELKEASLTLPLADTGVYYHPGSGVVHLFLVSADSKPGAEIFEKKGYPVEVHPGDTGETYPDSLFEDVWLTVKRAYSPVLRAFTDLTGFTPGPVNKWYGGPNPIAGTLLGGLAGAGLGYGAGALTESLANATGWNLLRNKRLRKTLGVIGGLAGAVPGVMWGAHSVKEKGLPGLVSSYPGINDNPGDPHELPTTENQLAPETPDESRKVASATEDPEAGIICEPLAYLQRVVPKELHPNFAMKVAAMGDAGSFGGEKIQVDSFGRAIWSPEDPFTPPDIRAAASGLVDAASMYRGGSSLVTPLDIGRVAIGMGSGLVSGLVVGKVLGALAGLSPGAQKALQQAGTWYGALKAVVPGVFSG